MPATALRCRICERQYPLDPIGVCSHCFGPLDPVYDRDEQRRTVSRESIAAGPPSIWRYAPLLPVAPPAEQRLAPGLTPLVEAPRLASALGVGELWLKLDTANPTHSFKDRVVAVACAKALELGRTTLSCSSTGNLANAVAARAAAEGLEAVVLVPADLEPEKLVATAVYGATILAVDGSYDDCSRLSVELSFELDWAFVNVGLRSYYAEGSKTLAFEIAEQLGWTFPDAVIAPIASGAMFTKVHQGFAELLELGLVDGTTPRLFGGQAEGCSPVATAFDAGAKVQAGAAEHDRAVARDRQPGGRGSRRRDGEGVRRLRPLGARGRHRRQHPPAGRDDRRVRRDRARRHRRCAARGGGARRARRGRPRRPARHRRRPEDPRLVSDRLDLVSVQPDADLILERLGVQV